MSKKIQVNIHVLRQCMVDQDIPSLGVLAEKLRPHVGDVSEPSIWRWNSDGWPVWKFGKLAEILNTTPDNLQS